jgi:hypothetical protein
MDALQTRIFQDEVQEFNAIAQPSPTIDLTDWPLTSTLVPSFTSNPNLLVTSQIAAHDYFEIQFNLDNNFWGVNFNFGNDQNGVHLRQGISHLINKGLFTNQQGDIKGLSVPIDNPVPAGSSFAGTALMTPNPCGWDLNFTQSGTSCVNGVAGGTAYNCSNGAACPTGTLIPTVNFPWQAPIGSPDFCAAAAHFITAFRHAGLGTLTQNSNCVLQPPAGQTSFPAAITSNTVNVFVRIDHHPRFELGISMAQELCALWTGALSIGSGTGCNFPGTATLAVSVTTGTTASFLFSCNLPPSLTVANPCWWIYTGGFENIFPFDRSLYLTYNGMFVSGVPGVNPPCASTTPSSSPSNFVFLCNPAYDAASAQMEFAPDVPTAISSATTTSNIFGRGAYTVPVWTGINQNVYLSNWQRVINADGVGIPHFFTWLDAYSPNPTLSGTIRQGFEQSTRSLSPYVATASQDFRMLRNIFDSPLVENPSNNGQLLDWMTRSSAILSNAQLGYPQCGSPIVQPCFPASTVANIRLNLRNDLFWQDGRQVTGFDIKFAYATLDANGAFAGSGLAPMVCTTSLHCTDGISVPNKSVVDVHLNAIGPFTRFSVGTTFVFPGRYWSASCPTAMWDTAIAGGNVPDTCMTLDPSKAGFTFDPIANHILIGSGPWACTDVLGGTGALGFGCSDTGTQNPPPNLAYTLTRYGKGQIPGSAAIGSYFRSSGSQALYVWSGAIGDSTQDSITGSQISACNKPSVTIQRLGNSTGCGHWQQGIGQPNGGPGAVTANQLNIFQRFLFVNWVSPFSWATPPCGFSAPGPPNPPPFPPPPSGATVLECTGPTSPPDNMASLTGNILYEGVNTLRPAATAGCNTAYNPTSPTSGGYDC